MRHEQINDDRRETVSRRRALKMGLATAGVVGLAGCSSQESAPSTETQVSTETSAPTSTETPAPTTTVAPRQFEPLSLQQGSIDVADFSTLGEPQVTISDFEVWLGDPGEGDVWLRWDTDAFYFAADVTNTVFENLIGTESTIWKNDAFQFALAPELPSETDDYVALTFSDTYQGPRLWYSLHSGTDESGFVTDIDARVEHFPDRGDGRTEFAFRVPWAKFGLEFDRAVGEQVSFTIAQHDWQRQFGEHWRNYGGGVLGEKVPSKLGTATFVA